MIPSVATLRAALAAVLLVLLVPAPGKGEPLEIRSEDGEHVARLSLETRARAEGWDAHASNTDWFTALRTRIGLRYAFRDRVRFLAEFQDARLHGLDDDSSGAGALYRTHSGLSDETHSDRIRQLWLEFEPQPGLRLRAGRQDIKLGTEVLYPEPSWKYLKIARLSQRLVGTVGWTHAERSNDGVALSWNREGHHLYAFAAKPTTGVFDVDSAYAGQDDILYGGASWTAKRGTWLPNTEVRLFGLAYSDERDADDGAFGGAVNDELDVYTFGGSLLGVYPSGDNAADLLLWGAVQWGDWALGLDHQGWAAAVEGGYRFGAAPLEPWVRLGVNAASGDRSPTDGDHESFFNMLPTNHLYYGFADRLALGNLIDLFAQLKVKPAERLDLNVFVHHFLLMTDDDGRHFGTGAFNKNAFGFGVEPQTSRSGHRGLGAEIDVVATYALHPRVTLQAGYSFLEGHAFLNGKSDDDVRFAYLQISARYP